MIEWMQDTIKTLNNKQRKDLTEEERMKMIHDAAAALGVTSNQLDSCKRTTMAKTARKVALVIWPNAAARAGLDAKKIDRKTLLIIYG